MTKRTLVSLVGFSLLALIFLFSGLLIFQSEASSSHEAQAGTTQIVSVTSSGEVGNHGSSGSAISADGRFIAFVSQATNLVSGDANDEFDIDVFVHDRLTGVTEIVSVSSSGEIGNGRSSFPSISADGQFIAFNSTATNLVPEDTDNDAHIFVHDRTTGKTEIVSVSSSGEVGNRESFSLSISADGRFVAFDSRATNLTPADTGVVNHIFVHDRSTKETEIVSVSSSGAAGNLPSFHPSISADGQFVAFQSFSTNFAPGDTNSVLDVFVHNRMTGETEPVSLTASGDIGDGQSEFSSISADGQLIAFHSSATGFVPGDSNDALDVFVYDRATKETEIVSVSSSGEIGNGHSTYPSISADGRFVTFFSPSANLVTGDTNDRPDIFIHDRLTKKTELISISSSGAIGNEHSFSPSISADGQFISFDSFSTNLVPENTNNQRQVFLHQRASSPGLATPTPAPTVDPSTLTNRNYLPVIVK